MQLHALTKHTKWRHQVEADYKEFYLYLTVTGSHAGQVNRHSPTDEWGTCYDSTLTVSSAIRGWKSNCVPVQNICKAVRLGVSTLNACLMTRRAEQQAASQLQFAVHTHQGSRTSRFWQRPAPFHLPSLHCSSFVLGELREQDQTWPAPPSLTLFLSLTHSWWTLPTAFCCQSTVPTANRRNKDLRTAQHAKWVM